MSHYIPSPNHFGAVYYVNLFYKIFIPLVLGFMIVLVGMDVGHSAYIKTRRGKKPTSPAAVAGPPSNPPQPDQAPVPGTSADEPAVEPPPGQPVESSTSSKSMSSSTSRSSSDQGELDEQGELNEQSKLDEQNEQGKASDGEVTHG
jgi:hypothetical protein